MVALILSSWVNNPENLVHQVNLFRKFCKEDFDYIAIIDAKPYEDFTNFNNKNMVDELVNACMRVNVKYEILDQSLHLQRDKVMPRPNIISENRNPATRTALSAQYSWNIAKKIAKNYDFVCFFQCDMFPIKEFSLDEWVQDNSLLYVSQKRDQVQYAWDGIFILRPSSEPKEIWDLIDFEDGFQDGAYTDAGGGMWKLLKKIENKKKVNYINSLQWSLCSFLEEPLQKFLLNDPRNQNGKFFAELYEGIILHLRAGGNWDNTNKDVYFKRQDLFNNFCKTINIK